MKVPYEDSPAMRPSAARRLLKAVGWERRAPPAAVPQGLRVYAVGDIHGCIDQLDRLHAEIAHDAQSHPGQSDIVYLGDFVDRGRDSKGAVDRLLHAVPTGFRPHYIKGNHDAALLEFLADPDSYRIWGGFGAGETLLSYGVRPPSLDAPERFEATRDALRLALPKEHLEFFRSLKLTATIGDYLFVHAGVRPGVAIEDQCEEDLLWIREEFLRSAAPLGKVVVHGHTPMRAPVRTSNRISVDTGAYATGTLTCAVLEGTGCRFLQATG